MMERFLQQINLVNSAVRAEGGKSKGSRKERAATYDYEIIMVAAAQHY
jgi:hypothetical protein